ncbi:MAG: DUF2791 family P-loop domain-containing protein, partial [Anaerolineales bacterium]|nr:DUF2791 family P-loop domain-containing protein [Anaerolineales bacterium]
MDSLICPNCGFAAPAGMRFCGMCGTRITVGCPQCEALNPLNFRFCGTCGARLPAATAPAAELPPFDLEALSYRPPAPPPLAGERREVTVVMTDVTSSTDLLEVLGTEAWVDLMNRMLHILEGEVHRFGGEVDQLRGDGLIAFFGASSAHEDDPERAVLTALSMQKAVARFSEDLARRKGIALHMRIGIDTGEVVVASVHDRRGRGDETAMGRAVTVAARMEAAAETGTVLVSENTHRLTETRFDWEALGELQVKGVAQPIRIYRPLAHRDEVGARRGADSLPLTVSLIGRDAEFHALKECVDAVFAGRGRIALLTGDRGSGKSFLVNELRRYFAHCDALRRSPSSTQAPLGGGNTWLVGRCRSYHQTWPFAVWVELLHDWLGTRGAASQEDTLDRLRAESLTLWGDEYGEYYPYLARLLTLPLEPVFQEKIKHLGGEHLRQRVFHAVQAWVSALAGRGPLVLVLAEMQWADESSVQLLRHCLSLSETEAVLALVVYAPEVASPIWDLAPQVEIEYPHRLTRVDLLPLEAARAADLIAGLVGAEVLPTSTRDLIIRLSEGNPYFIIESIYGLMMRGVLQRAADDSQWRLTRPVLPVDLPTGSQRLLLARIDRLSLEQRFVVQVAAVIGAVFWYNLLEALVTEPGTLRVQLAALQRAQLIQEDGRVAGLGMQYSFRSAQVREAAYESLIHAQRAEFHRRAAAYLETSGEAESLPGFYSLLAHHYRGAGDLRKELFYALLAAEQARRLYANAEALQHYSRAVDLADQIAADPALGAPQRALLSQRFEILRGRRTVQIELGLFSAAAEDSRALLALSDQMADDPAWRIDALLSQPELFERERREDAQAGLRHAYEALGLAHEIGDRRREMEAWMAVAGARVTLHDPTAREAAERALDLSRELGDLRAEVALLLAIANVYGLDDLQRHEAFLHEALAKSESLDDKAMEVALLGALGAQFERRGDYYRQLVEFERPRAALCREIGNRLEEGKALMMCGQIQGLYLGDIEPALALEHEAAQIWGELTNRLFPLLRIAQMQTALGRFDAALEALESAWPLSERGTRDFGRAGYHLVSAMLDNARGGVERLLSALDHCEQVKQLVSDNLVSRQYHMAASCQSAMAHLTLGRLTGVERDRRDHYRSALVSSSAALAFYSEFGFTQVIECLGEEILLRHSQTLAAAGQAVEAADFLRQAHAEMMRKL